MCMNSHATDIKPFDKILAEAKLEAWKSNPNKVLMQEFCAACDIPHTNGIVCGSN